MTPAQQSGTGAKTELDDEKVRKDDILSNRDKSQRLPGQSLDGKGVQVDEYKDMPTNQRPAKSDADVKEPNKPKSDETKETIDRPGFDLGGSTGETTAGKGLGLGSDAKKGRKGWGLPRSS